MPHPPHPNTRLASDHIFLDYFPSLPSLTHPISSWLHLLLEHGSISPSHPEPPPPWDAPGLLTEKEMEGGQIPPWVITTEAEAQSGPAVSPALCAFAGGVQFLSPDPECTSVSPEGFWDLPKVTQPVNDSSKELFSPDPNISKSVILGTHIPWPMNS